MPVGSPIVSPCRTGDQPRSRHGRCPRTAHMTKAHPEMRLCAMTGPTAGRGRE
ncbi:hypothetical protein XAPC_493 [Xanthomonas citri pv. punicae str. LMG 859]|nr:hypothetical protein XAPC_493 [Xanthomonas citri pv. punicae str. LMG 859]